MKTSQANHPMEPYWLDWGILPYRESLDQQCLLHSQVSQNESHPGYIILVEHPPVVTMGNRQQDFDLLLPSEELERHQVSFFKTDRGGSVTAHEPGQLIIYPIIPLRKYGFQAKSWVWFLEECVIKLAETYSLVLERHPINPGLWFNCEKVASVGIRIKNRVSMHGIAINLNNSLKTFDFIVPCGLKNMQTTSLKKILNQEIDVALLKNNLKETWNRKLREHKPQQNGPSTH